MDFAVQMVSLHFNRQKNDFPWIVTLGLQLFQRFFPTKPFRYKVMAYCRNPVVSGPSVFSPCIHSVDLMMKHTVHHSLIRHFMHYANHFIEDFLFIFPIPSHLEGFLRSLGFVCTLQIVFLGCLS